VARIHHKTHLLPHRAQSREPKEQSDWFNWISTFDLYRSRRCVSPERATSDGVTWNLCTQESSPSILLGVDLYFYLLRHVESFKKVEINRPTHVQRLNCLISFLMAQCASCRFLLPPKRFVITNIPSRGMESTCASLLISQFPVLWVLQIFDFGNRLLTMWMINITQSDVSAYTLMRARFQYKKKKTSTRHNWTCSLTSSLKPFHLDSFRCVPGSGVWYLRRNTKGSITVYSETKIR